MFPSADRIFRRLAEDKRQPQKNRISALNKIARPSLSMLRRLCSATTPPKLRYAASLLYEKAMARKSLTQKETKTKKDVDVASSE
jgi:hypothetical protein